MGVKNKGKSNSGFIGGEAKTTATKKASDQGSDSFTSKLKVRGGSGSTTK